MPDPLRALHKDVGLWYPHDLPSPSAVRVLRHLLQKGSPRLFVLEKDGRMSASVTNSDTRPGFATRIDIWRLIRDHWIEVDKEWDGRRASNVRVYRIAENGIEAIAQFNTRKRYQREHIQLAKHILAQSRKAVARARR